MVRPRKPRLCCCPYSGRGFRPIGVPIFAVEKVTLQRDELEAMRLVDLENLTQEEAGKAMGVSRGTVQRLLQSARGKVTCALVEKKALIFADDVASASSDL